MIERFKINLSVVIRDDDDEEKIILLLSPLYTRGLTHAHTNTS